MILLIDNYDSFTYNLYQYMGEIDPDIAVYRNDTISIDDIRRIAPTHIVISPGPGYPSSAGISIPLIRAMDESVPILGVCLGHQAIGEAYGGNVVHARELMHGKSSDISLDNDCELFEGMPAVITGGRYHSLIVDRDTLPSVLQVTALSPMGEIMALKHKQHKVFGIQFHPESILTPLGKEILRNFLKLKLKPVAS